MMNRLDPQKVLSALGLPAAWRGRDRYVIMLSDTRDLAAMLVIFQAWHEDHHRPRCLHFICSAPSWVPYNAWLSSARQLLPDLSGKEGVRALAAGWPIDVPGVQRTELDGHVATLTWCLGELSRPDMLGVKADDVLSSRDLNLTPDLSLAGWNQRQRLDEQDQAQRQADGHPWLWATRAPANRKALVVGAGFAGLGVAHSLARRGWRVTLLDPGWRKQEGNVHSDHLAAALTPVASKDDNARARLSRAGALCAHQRWRHLDESIISRCGALQLQRMSGRTKPLDEVVESLGFSRQWISHVTAEQASDLAGMRLGAGGIWYPFGCMVRPGLFLDALSQTTGVEVVPFEVHRIRHEYGGWQALDREGRTVDAPLMVIANAGSIRTVLQNSDLWPHQGRLSQMHALAGQITMIPKHWLGGGPRCIVGGDGYVLPEVEGWCVSGGTYVRGAERADITPKGVQENLARAHALLGRSFVSQHLDGSVLPGWAGWRAVLPGRLPAVGPLEGHDGLWIATGYASRGLTWSSLAGELIAGFLDVEPLLLEDCLLNEIKLI